MFSHLKTYQFKAWRNIILLCSPFIFCHSALFAKEAFKSITVPATSLAAQGSQFKVTNGHLGISAKKQETASISSTVPMGNSRFTVSLHTLGSKAGRSTYQLTIGNNTLDPFIAPVATKHDESGQPFIHTWPEVYINEGEKFTLTASNSSLNGKLYSQAIWSKLVFTPLDKDPGKVLANLARTRKQADIEAGPALAIKRQPNGNGNITLSGEMKTWHPITLTMNGPFAHEQDISPNPFLDYRMSVTFAHESGVPTYTVPGYFSTDGDAANTSAEYGIKWRAHVSPDKPGQWTYRVSFVQGQNAAISPAIGEYVQPYQGKFGRFTVKKSDKTGKDFRAKGRLAYVGGHYLRHAGSGEYFLKAGTDAPETYLAYTDFDNPLSVKKNVPVKTWAPHAQDFKTGDPTWQNGKGKNIMGSLNYLASTGANAISFLTYNAGGDGDNVWPYVERNGKLHFDSSKLDQWNIVFSHAQNLGLYLHFKLQENESDDDRRGAKAKLKKVPESMDGGLLGTERKLYLREIIARFGHHLALNWNIGEENTQSYEEQRDMAEYIHNVDAYDHNLVIHSFPNQQERVYKRLLGSQSVLTGASLQNSWRKAHQQTLRWVEASRAAGKPWVVANDEQNPANMGVPPDPGFQGFDGWATDGKTQYNLDDIRKYTLWGNLMAGGAGVEYYFGYRLKENDLTAQNLRSRDKSWRYAGIALKFFEQYHIPFHRMRNLNALIGNPKNTNSKYCFANEGEIYLVYLPKGGSADLNLTEDNTRYNVQWFNPRTGEKLLTGSVKQVTGGNTVELGQAPKEKDQDWLIMLTPEKK